MEKKPFPIGRRVAECRKAKDLSQTALAKTLGMTQTGIADIEAGRVKRPGKLKELSEALGVPQEWLLTGINYNEMKSRVVTKRSIGSVPDIDLNAPAVVPEIEINAGASYAGGFAQEVADTDDFGNVIAADAIRANWGIPAPFLRDELHIRPGRAHILSVRGDSMRDALFDGDRAIINLDDTDVSQGGIFALLDDNASVIIKQVELVRGGSDRRIRCTSRNSAYAPFDLVLDETVRIIGRVASKITRL